MTPTSTRVDGDGLTSSEPACNEHARQLLATHGIYVRSIVRVYADAILFVNPASRVETAWLRTSEDGRQQKIVREGGFPAWPEG